MNAGRLRSLLILIASCVALLAALPGAANAEAHGHRSHHATAARLTGRHAAHRLEIASTARISDSRRIVLHVRCPEGGCTGRVALTLVAAVTSRSPGATTASAAVLGATRYRVTRGHARQLTIVLNRSAYAMLESGFSGGLPAELTITPRGGHAINESVTLVGPQVAVSDVALATGPR